jgi:sialate O-acetylesterase
MIGRLNRAVCELLVLLLLASACAEAVVAPAQIFSNGMVLQHDMNVPVFGTALPGASVTVTFRGATAQSTADVTGRWSVDIASDPPGGPFPMSIQGDTSVSYPWVYVGDVWLCAGQSNMQYSTSMDLGPAPFVPPAPDPRLHLFTAGHASWQQLVTSLVRTFYPATPSLLGLSRLPWAERLFNSG